MKKMFVFMSHQLTEEQKEAAMRDLGIEEFVFLHQDLQEKFSNVPTELKHLDEYVEPFLKFVFENSQDDDVIFLAGEQGLVVTLVREFRTNILFGYRQLFKIVYSTTNRIVEEVINPDGIVTKKSMFKHVLFREM